MPTYTLEALSQRVLDLLDGNSAEFPQANITAALNNGLSRLNCILGLNSATIPVPGFTVANQLAYTNPVGIFIPTRWDYEGQELQKMPLGRLARAYPTWASDLSSNIGPAARVGVIDFFQFVLHPIDAYGGGLLEVTGITPTTPLVNAGDVVGLDDEWAEILIAWAKLRCLFKEGGKPFADAVAAFKPYQIKLREASIWRDVAWANFWVDVKQRMNFERWPV